MIGKMRGLVPAVIRRSYALKFGIVLLLLALSVGAIGLVATASVTDSVEANALEDQEAFARQEAITIDNWNEQNERRTASTANTPVVEDGEVGEIQSYLNDLQLDLSGQVVDVHYVDQETGDLLATTADDAQTLEDVDFPDRDRIDSELSAVEVQRTDAYETDGSAAVSYYVSTSGSDRTAIVMTFDLEDVMTDLGGGEERDSVTFAVDRDGRLVLDGTFTGTGQDALQGDFVGNRFLEEYENDHSLLDEALGSQSPTHSDAIAYEGSPGGSLADEPYEFTPDGYVAAYHGTEMGLIVLTHTSAGDAYGFVDTVNQYGTLATVGGVLLIGLVGAVLGRNTAASIDRLTQKAARMEEGDLDVDLETKRIDNIGRLYDGFDSMRAELKDTIHEAERARAEAEAEREEVERINDHLERKATDYSDVMQSAADGDLTVRMDADGEHEAMTEIAEEFNEMLAEIETTIDRLTQFATDVATASEQVTASSEEVRSASREVSSSIQEISDGAERQHQSLQSVDTQMNNLSTTTQQIAASSNDVADIAERTARTSRDGREAAQEAIDACDDLEDEYRDVVAEFDELREQVDQIDELADTIAEIAEQTNMLALNANIEASRSASGSDTEGFSTVAAEVKELSQDVKGAAKQIGDRLEAVQTQTERSATEVDQTSEEIERVNDLVSDVVTALEDIADYAGQTNDGVQEISAATEQQAASTQEVVAMVDEVATISEETTAEAETVAAAAEEQTSALTEVSNSADELSQQATVLSEALDRFDTDADGDREAASLDDVAGLEEITEAESRDDGNSGESEASDGNSSTDDTDAAFAFDEDGDVVRTEGAEPDSPE
ncbi:methyl-accepting chemotaxis protein [Halobiforma lacisalsi AJ5]|uniref:Methyl-accepting chemotaxis protein n=1 Tax=Natronobacterium lacisalsi AJ5 TaxID=358396 RepID=M0LJ02_NATLA|nr:methyl-accepting chemotaxis protein [Halobiforma lacisalsi]APW98513.1 methyl-accepting chemotaxis protein [Halobiforma lacisalsi AJ5]EMA33038.1 methyl-accepting chemotaxis sensory transducer [Halobiforma lacisalsi AJ5]